MTSTQIFRNLHQGAAPLMLPNAWDAGSARLIESLGAQAIATTSAGLCWAQGYADGDRLPIDALIAATRQIARVIEVPLSIDIEAGYSDAPAVVADLVMRLMDAGAVGINLEDGSEPPERLCAKIEAVKASAAKAGADVFINARTDVYLRGLATGPAAADAVMDRALMYQRAGCDGLFVPGLTDVDAIANIARSVPSLPLNLLQRPGLAPLNALHTLHTLHTLGVRRLSAGSSLALAALGHLRGRVENFLAGDLGEVFTHPTADYGAMNKLFAEQKL